MISVSIITLNVIMAIVYYIILRENDITITSISSEF